jgi:hypothetical protein
LDILTSELILSIGAHRTTLRPPGIAIEPNVGTRFGLPTHDFKVSATATLGEYSRIDRRLLLDTLLAKSLACGPRLQTALVTHFTNASVHPLPAIAVFKARLACCLHLLLSLLLHHFALLPPLELEIAATLILLGGPLLHLLLASGLHLLLTLLLPRLTLLILLDRTLLHLLLASGLHLLLTLLLHRLPLAAVTATLNLLRLRLAATAVLAAAVASAL